MLERKRGLCLVYKGVINLNLIHFRLTFEEF